MNSKVFACYNKDEAIRIASSSGGIYTLLAECILAAGGCVYAACYNKNLEVVHKKCTTAEQLEASRGSKYMPSHLGETFFAVKSDLLSGRKVLFVGTPCQCAGLQTYLSDMYENLLLVDFVCHGVPSRLAWRKYIQSLNNNGFKLASINMRDKSSGWKSYSWRLTDRGEHIKYENKNDNPYMKGFVANLFLRPSCHECKFKGIERGTDFTLGDYWGVQRLQPEMDDDKGTSLLFVHTEKAQELFDKISSKIFFTDAMIQQALQSNPCIVDSTNRSAARPSFFERLNRGEEFISIVEDLTRLSVLNRIKGKMRAVVRKVVRRVNA